MPKRELYMLAAHYRKTKLWERLEDSELIAIQMPDGEIGYICIMGALGEHIALAVYLGNAGLDSYRKVFQGVEDLRETERAERMMGQDCVMCSFSSKSELRPRDLKEFEEYGLTFRGKQAYPIFERYRPLHYPWYLEDAHDEEYLRLGLLAGLEIARRLNDVPVQQDLFHAPDPGASKEMLGIRDGAPYDREIPLLTLQTGDTFGWEHIALPSPLEQVYATPKMTDDITRVKLKKKPKHGAWECGVFMLPKAATDEAIDPSAMEPAQAPTFPLVVLIVDHADGKVHHFGMTAPSGDTAKELMNIFVEGMKVAGVPAEIIARDARTQAILTGVAIQLGIRLSMEEDLPFLDRAEDVLVHSTDQQDGADRESVLVAMLDSMHINDLPDEMIRQLKNLQEKATLSDETAEKLRRFLAGDDATIERNANETIRKLGQRVPGSYVVSVSLGKGCYRHLRISDEDTLEDFHRAILDAFDFQDGPAHVFFLDNRMWSDAVSYYSKDIKAAERFTKDATLSHIDLRPGMPFKYVFDFGKEWAFQCKVLRAMWEPTATPQVIRRIGAVPEKYGKDASAQPGVNSANQLNRLKAEHALPKKTIALLHRYFDAFAQLYGILPLRKALTIYNNQNPPITEESFIQFVEIARHGEFFYAILGRDELNADGHKQVSAMDREIIEESLLLDFNYYEKVLAAQKGKPYYMPPKHELLRFADNHYYEKPASFHELKDYLRKKRLSEGCG